MTETGLVESEVTLMLVTDVVDEIVDDNYKKLVMDLTILIIKPISLYMSVVRRH